MGRVLAVVGRPGGGAVTLALIAIALFMRPSPIAPMLRPAGNHSVTLTWVDVANPAGTTYNVYRGAGGCSADTFVVPLGTSATGKYVDLAVVAGGAYCYAVSSVDIDGESTLTTGVSANIPHSGKWGVSNVVAQ